MRVQGGVLTICTLLSVNFGIVTFASAENRGCRRAQMSPSG